MVACIECDRATASGMSPRSHSSFREGAILGAVVGTGIWVWIALVDAIVGQPFRTFAVLGREARGKPDRRSGIRVLSARARVRDPLGDPLAGRPRRARVGSDPWRERRRARPHTPDSLAQASPRPGAPGWDGRGGGVRILALVHRLRLWLAATALAISGCGGPFPQSRLQPRSDFARATDVLFTDIFWWATGVFLVVETLLVVALIRFRHREGRAAPKPTHGHTLMEIAWTLAPAAILVFVAVPTVRTIFATAGEAPA